MTAVHRRRAELQRRRIPPGNLLLGVGEALLHLLLALRATAPQPLFQLAHRRRRYEHEDRP